MGGLVTGNVRLYDQYDNVIEGSNPGPVTLATALSSEYDTIDVDKMSKGGVITAHEDIGDTVTSDEIDMRGYNTQHVQVIIIGTGTWTISLHGSAHTGGIFTLEEIDGSAVEITGITANKNFVFFCAPKYTKIIATKTGGTATVTVYVTPIHT